MSNKYATSQKRKHLYKYTKTIYDFYHSFGEQYSELDVDKTLFISVAKDFLQELMEEQIIKSTYRYKMPYRLGILRIRKRTPTRTHGSQRIDWAKTKQLNKTVYHMNHHTGKSYFKFHWEKGGAAYKHFRNRGIYMFKPARKNKRFLAAHIKHCATDPYTRDYTCLDK